MWQHGEPSYDSIAQITGYAKSHLTALSERSKGTTMKDFSAWHTCFLKFPLFPLAYFLPVLLYLPFLFRNSFHSLLYSMMLLASGALYSNLFHILIILCAKEFWLLLFCLFPNFLIFRSYLLTSLVLKRKDFAWINFINPPYNF